jgi:antitoxin HicB
MAAMPCARPCARCANSGDPVPRPGSFGASSGQWRQRVPKSLHARLVARAAQEGVSLDTLVTALLAEGLEERRSRAS